MFLELAQRHCSDFRWRMHVFVICESTLELIVYHGPILICHSTASPSHMRLNSLYPLPSRSCALQWVPVTKIPPQYKRDENLPRLIHLSSSMGLGFQITTWKQKSVIKMPWP